MAVLAVHVGLVYLGWTLRVEVAVVRDMPIITQLRLMPVQPQALTPTDAPRASADRQGGGLRRHFPAARPTIGNQMAAPAVQALPAPEPLSPAEPPVAAHGVVPSGSGRVALDGSEVAATVAAPASRPASSRSVPVRSPSGLSLTPDDKVMQGTPKNAALTDPRSNTPKPTFEERIAIGMDPDLCVKVERLPDGSTRRSLVRRVRIPTLAATQGVGAASVGVCP